MTSLPRVYRPAGSSPRRSKTARRHRDLPPRFEALESRTLLSLTPHLVANLNTLGASSSPQDFTAVGATTFFLADDGVHGQELWKTNGATAGTSIVKDINPGSVGSEHLRHDGTSTACCSSSPTTASTATSSGRATARPPAPPSSTTLHPGPESSNSYTVSAAVLGGKMYFSADDGTHGKELWVTNGTTAGTTMVTDINPGPGGSYPSQLTPFNGKLFFEADDGTHGYELWQSDGTAAGTTLFDDINPGSGQLVPELPHSRAGANLYFVADDGTNGRRALEERWHDRRYGDLVIDESVIPSASRMLTARCTSSPSSSSGRPTARSPAPPSSARSPTRDT